MIKFYFIIAEEMENDKLVDVSGDKVNQEEKSEEILNLNNIEQKNEENKFKFNNSEQIPGVVQPLSKNQLKKMKKKEEWDIKKKEIKKFKKEQKKEKKLKSQEENKPVEEVVVEKPKVLVPSRKERQQENLEKIKNGTILIIDCGFENLMNERDIISLVRQIAFCYSENKKAENPFDFILYDVGDLVMQKLLIHYFDKWTGVKLIKKGEYKSIDEFLFSYNETRDVKIENFSKDKIVYLTADSENEVNELKGSEVYIIGGIVDRNRFKNITFTKAKELGINHGKLPIGDYIHLNSSKVMTTNHVFSILTYFNSVKKDWKDAFMSIIPKRKLEE